ncbi:MAG: TlyA family RNA methyltransferase [Alphaproteobacteria bacterium]|nr:TlyA family RNA methyltransferase [Alphaproteobacteria bacterium]
MPNARKKRADILLVERGLVETRARAQAVIMAGLVFSDDRRIAKAGETLAADAPLEVRGEDHPWASRGGVKLAHAMEQFGFDIDGATCLDVGASTGGFCDVLLHYGAARVFAVDVGQGQLAWKLRQDDRVTVLENTNARYLTRDHVPDVVDFITCDVSFIGLEKVLPAAMALTHPGSGLIALIKPQFQAGRDKIGKGGIVTDPAVQDEVCATVSRWLNDQEGWRVIGLTESPVHGAKGNREFLIAAVRDA